MRLLQMQLRFALKRTCAIQEATLDLVMKGIEEKVITAFTVYAVDAAQLCRGEMVLDIRWDEHNRQLALGNTLVVIDEKRLQDGALLETKEAADLFGEFIETYRMHAEWHVTLSPAVTGDKSRFDAMLARFGFQRAKPIRWAGGVQVREKLTNRQLSELQIGLRLVDE
jgi:hypothetical protein